MGSTVSVTRNALPLRVTPALPEAAYRRPARADLVVVVVVVVRVSFPSP